MKIRLVEKGLTSDETFRAYVRERVDTTLKRLSSAVTAVRIHIEDVNGPRGGLDKRCVVTASGTTFEPLIVETRDSNLHAAVANALTLAARAVVRALERGRDGMPRRRVRRSASPV